MLDVHIDDFFKDCATIFLIGFRQFPREQVLFVEDISGPDDVDEFGLHSPRHMAAFGAVQWLREEEYIRFGSEDGAKSVDEFVLTSKAMRILLRPAFSAEEAKALNADYDPTQTLIQLLEYARLQGDSTLLQQLLQTHLFN